MDSSDPIVCFPGDRLCATSENTIAGTGTYERSGYIYASLAGIVETKTEEKVKNDSKHGRNNKQHFIFIAEHSDKGESIWKQDSPASCRRCGDSSRRSRQPALCQMSNYLHR